MEEFSPLSAETKTDDDEEESTDKNAGRLGIFAVKPEARQPSHQEAPPKETQHERAESSHGERPADKLEPDEIAEAANMLMERSAAESPSHNPAESPEVQQAEAMAVEVFHEFARQETDEDFTIPYERARAYLLEQGIAFDEALDENPEPVLDQSETLENAPGEANELLTDELAEETVEDVQTESGFPDSEVLFDRTAEVSTDADIEEDLADGRDSGAASSGRGRSAPPPPPGTSGAGGHEPPAGPFGPAPFGPSFGGPGGLGGFHGAAPLPRAETHHVEELDDGGNAAGAALLGAIVGYFIGRRRGRIKAEKQAKKVEKRLTKQIENMHWNLKDKESKLRRMAAERVKQEGPAVMTRLETARAAIAPAQAIERRPAEIISDAEPLLAARQRAPEAHQLHGSQKTPEQIGHVLVAAEAPIVPSGRLEKAVPERRIETRQAEQTIVPRVEAIKLPPEKHVEVMSQAELLSFSERIIVEGSSLRQIYESHLVGDHGLRRLVAEHLRGGDLKKALRREIVEREIDFERDPAMRDVAVAAGPVAAGGGKAVLNHLVEQAAAKVVDPPNEQLAFYKARAQYEIKQHEQEQQQRRVVDVALGTVIAVLTGIIIVLYLTHR